MMILGLAILSYEHLAEQNQNISKVAFTFFEFHFASRMAPFPNFCCLLLKSLNFVEKENIEVITSQTPGPLGLTGIPKKQNFIYFESKLYKTNFL